jgi:hypothetical protein
MSAALHLTQDQLEAGLEHIRGAPKNEGTLELIVRRPDIGAREVLPSAQLDLTTGLVGDNWRARGSSSMPDRSANPEMQLNVMNARVVALLAQTRDRWALAGDQLFVDFDLGTENLPPGTRLALGDAIIEVTAVPHNGCKKFTERFGLEAVKFVNSPLGKQLRMRGLNAKVVRPGTIRAGEVVRKLA